MPANRTISLMILSVMICGVTGCVGTTAPSKSIPTAESSPRDAYGAWAHIQLLSPRQFVDGELIAAVAETVYVLKDTLVALPREHVFDVRLTRFQQEHSPMILWSMLGTLGSISHGFFLLGSMPMWIISGSLASAKASKEPIVHPRSVRGRSIGIHELQALATYSRFPQGLPQNLDRSQLRPRR